MHEGNYSCIVRNSHGSDYIIYQLFVQVPPNPPDLTIASVTSNSVTLEWLPGDSGGAPLRGYLLAYRPEFGEWDEKILDRRSTTFLLDNLHCGTRYQFTLSAFNKIGSGTSSKIENTRTKGNKPVPPQSHQLIRSNVTSVNLDLAAWQDGGCQILYFTVEFRRNGNANDWIVVSSNIVSQSRFLIPDLEPASAYNLRITAHNNAGATITEYFFETLTVAGKIVSADLDGLDGEKSVQSLFKDSNVLAVLIISILSIVLALGGVCVCMRSRKFRRFFLIWAAIIEFDLVFQIHKVYLADMRRTYKIS